MITKSPDTRPSDASVVDTVLIYVFDETLQRVLTFEQHEAPQAGQQIPAGTVEPGENTLHAAVRELAEETGRAIRSTLHSVATSQFDSAEVRPHIHHRTWFYVVDREQDFGVERWQSIEKRADAPDIVARFAWIDIAEATGKLTAGHGEFLADALALARVERV